jgi:hypothetical protein
VPGGFFLVPGGFLVRFFAFDPGPGAFLVVIGGDLLAL